jgi:hypothetical protein
MHCTIQYQIRVVISASDIVNSPSQHIKQMNGAVIAKKLQRMVAGRFAWINNNQHTLCIVEVLTTIRVCWMNGRPRIVFTVTSGSVVMLRVVG